MNCTSGDAAPSTSLLHFICCSPAPCGILTKTMKSFLTTGCQALIFELEFRKAPENHLAGNQMAQAQSSHLEVEQTYCPKHNEHFFFPPFPHPCIQPVIPVHSLPAPPAQPLSLCCSSTPLLVGKYKIQWLTQPWLGETSRKWKWEQGWRYLNVGWGSWGRCHLNPTELFWSRAGFPGFETAAEEFCWMFSSSPFLLFTSTTFENGFCSQSSCFRL